MGTRLATRREKERDKRERRIKRREGLCLVNQISEELKTPGLFHARIIAPVCNRVRPSSTLCALARSSKPPSTEEQPKETRRPPPPPPPPLLPYFHLFSLLRYLVRSLVRSLSMSRDAKMAGRCKVETVSAFLKNAPTLEHVCTRVHMVPSPRGERGEGVFQALKIHDIRGWRRREEEGSTNR